MILLGPPFPKGVFCKNFVNPPSFKHLVINFASFALHFYENLQYVLLYNVLNVSEYTQALILG